MTIALTTLDPSKLPAGWQQVKLPEVYKAAIVALAECERLDECKDWADKMAALASYARQHHDQSLEQMARRIRLRATRRCGDPLVQPTA